MKYFILFDPCNFYEMERHIALFSHLTNEREKAQMRQFAQGSCIHFDLIIPYQLMPQLHASR